MFELGPTYPQLSGLCFSVVSRFALIADFKVNLNKYLTIRQHLQHTPTATLSTRRQRFVTELISLGVVSVKKTRKFRIISL